MKTKKKLFMLLAVLMASLVFLTACGGEKTDKLKEDANEVKEDVKDLGEDAKDKVEDKADEVTDKVEEKTTEVRVANLTNDIVKEFKKVEIKDLKITSDIKDPSQLSIADIYLYIDEEDKARAEELIETYSEIFIKELNKEESYEEVILIWTSPNHDDDNPIEKITYVPKEK